MRLAHSLRHSLKLWILGLVIVSSQALAQAPLVGDPEVLTEAAAVGTASAVELASGDWLVVWVESATDEPSSLWARVVDSGGIPKAAAFGLDVTGIRPTLARLSNDEVVVAWIDAGAEIWARRLGADGSVSGSAFRIDQGVPVSVDDPDIVPLGAAGFLAAWWSEPGGFPQHILARGFDSLDTATGDAYRLDQAVGGRRIKPDIEIDPTGGYRVVYAGVGGDSRLFSRRLDAVGLPSGDAVLLAEETEHITLKNPKLAILDDGSFAVAWHWATFPTPSLDRVFLGVFDINGTMTAGPRDLSPSNVSGRWGFPSLRRLGNDAFIVGWNSFLHFDFESQYSMWDRELHLLRAPSPLEIDPLAESYTPTTWIRDEVGFLMFVSFGDESQSLTTRRFVGPLFIDGFETGDLSSWSSQQP